MQAYCLYSIRLLIVLMKPKVRLILEGKHVRLYNLRALV